MVDRSIIEGQAGEVLPLYRRDIVGVVDGPFGIYFIL